MTIRLKKDLSVTKDGRENSYLQKTDKNKFM